MNKHTRYRMQMMKNELYKRQHRRTSKERSTSCPICRQKDMFSKLFTQSFLSSKNDNQCNDPSHIHNPAIIQKITKFDSVVLPAREILPLEERKRVLRRHRPQVFWEGSK